MPGASGGDAAEPRPRAEGIRTVVWATGYGRDYAWLDAAGPRRRGEIAHRGGVTAAPGSMSLGQRFQSAGDSNFIDGVGRDAEAIADRHRAGFRAPLAA